METLKGDIFHRVAEGCGHMTPISTNRKRVTRAFRVSQSFNLTLLSLDPWPCWHSRLLALAQRKARSRGGIVANPALFLPAVL